MAIDINLGLSAAATGTVDVITATYSPAPTLVDRKILFLRTAGTNTTTTPTFNPNGLGAKTIVKQGGAALVAGDLVGDVVLMYNATLTQWELLNPRVRNLGTTAGTVAAGDDSRLSSSIHTTFSAALNPADGTTYYSMIIGGFPQVSIGSSGMRFLRTGTITDFNIIGAHVVNGSGESTSIYLRNVTTATDYLITSAWLENYGASTFKNQSYTGLSIPVGNTTDLWNIKIVYPTFATNPTNVQYSWGILLK